MALFCARYLTSSPFTLGLSDNDIRKYAITGYYGFQDYAAACWWKHAHRLISRAADVERDLYNRAIQAIARAMEAYGNFDNNVPELGGYTTDAVQCYLRDVAKDAHEWEKNFKIEFRTRAIRNIIEILLSEEGASEAHCCILTLYGAVRYKCPKPWCKLFCIGFERHKDREQHVLEHDRPFRCSVEGCSGNHIGYSSEVSLSRHNERLHSTLSTIHFASPRPPKSEPQVICSAAMKGDLAKVKACLRAGIPIHTARANMGSETPLYLAAKNGHIHVCRYLLEQGANVNFRGRWGSKRTALHAAIQKDDEELTRLFLSQPDINLKVTDKDNYTAAGSAARDGCDKALSVFISEGLASEPGQNPQNGTCLSIALAYGRLKTAELLLNDTSLNLNADDNKYDIKLPLHVAARGGFVRIVKLLLSSGRVDVNKVDRDGQQALHHACVEGHASIVELLLPVVHDHDVRDHNGETPLQQAVVREHTAVVKLLLESGKCDPNLPDELGLTPLWYAIKNVHDTIFKLLLNSGKIDVNKVDLDGKQALHHACAAGHASIVELLLPVVHDHDVRDHDGETPLQRAVVREHTAVVKLLLESGKCDPNLPDELGLTPLWYAIKNAHNAIFKLLLNSGKVDADLTGRDGRTMLSYAAEVGDELVIKLLLGSSKVNPNRRDGWNRTPLSYAIEKRHIAVVKLLFESGKVDVDADLLDQFGRTWLSHAAETKYSAVLERLLESSDADLKDQYGRTWLSYAAEIGDESSIKLLLGSSKVNPDIRDGSNRTPLSYAIEKGHIAVVKLLLDSGKVDGDAELIDQSGRTWLSHAAEERHPVVVKQLLESSDTDLTDQYGRTWLSYAAEGGDEAFVEQLLDSGKANPDSMDNSSRTPLSYAAEKGHVAVVKLLLENDKVDINSMDKDGRTPLSYATAGEFEAVIRLLQL
jgi:ankyrin repeat protein